jgi:hypothetical protein
MATDCDAVVQESFALDKDLRTSLAEGLDQAGWQQRTKNETVFTVCEANPTLKTAIKSLASALVHAGKIRREEDSGNIIRVEGPYSLTISNYTHIVPISITGSPPTVGSNPLAVDTIVHIRQGKISVEPTSSVCFSFYSQHPDQVKSSRPSGNLAPGTSSDLAPISAYSSDQ